MRKVLSQGTLILAALTLSTLAAAGQEVVHALGGTVTAIYPATHTIKVSTDDGSTGLFEIMKTETPLNFQKSVRALTVPAGSFNKPNNQIVIFFFGQDSIRTAVAVEDLGDATLEKTVGTLLRIDKHAHEFTVKDSTGAQKTFQIDAKTICDASQGVVDGQKFDIDKGAQVRITSVTQNGTSVALLVRALSL
jgi:phage baseplate assembly protein gpV